MEDYILDYEAKYNKLAKKKMTYPPSVLGFKLIDHAGLNQHERMLVLSGLDYSQKDQMFKHAKSSLRKFKGDYGGISGTGGQSTCSSIKVEPAFITEHEDVFLAAGWTKPSNRNNNKIITKKLLLAESLIFYQK